MGYVVVVFCLINTAALLAVGYYIRVLWRDLPMYVSKAIQDEVKKQDDRIEKRIARAGGQAEDTIPTALDGQSATGLRPGQPYRR